MFAIRIAFTRFQDQYYQSWNRTGCLWRMSLSGGIMWTRKPVKFGTTVFALFFAVLELEVQLMLRNSEFYKEEGRTGVADGGGLGN